MECLDTMIDGTFPIAEWDLALLQMSEGTQGARTLTLHPLFPGNFSHHLALSMSSVCLRCPLTIAPFHPKPLLPATVVHVLVRGVVGAGLLTPPVLIWG